MKRFDAYFGQLVSEADVDDWFDAAEQALWDLAIDIGLLGVKAGAELTQQGAGTTLYIEAGAGCRAYDQAGKRLYFGPTQTIDCSQDEDGNPTIPSSGKERIIMIELKFKRALSDLRTDDNGASVYYQRDESFEINVVAGAEVTAPATYPDDAPTAPSDALILGDIILQNGQTAITTGDIILTRRQNFVWTQAENIGVTAGSWTKIDSGSAHVQDALDSVDTELISRETDGDIGQTLLPKDNTVDLGSATNVWGEAHLTDPKVYNALTASADRKVIGDATNRFDFHTYQTTVYNSILANATGLAIGSVTAQFDAYLRNLTIYNSIKCSADGKALGDASFRFVPHLEAVLLYDSTVADALKFSAAKSVTIMVPIHDFRDFSGSGWDWNSTAIYLQASSASTMFVFFKPLHGATMTSMRIRWMQSASTGMTAQIQSFDEDNAGTNIGSAKTITTIDSSTNWDIIASGLSEVINLSSKGYRVKVDATATATHQVRMLEITYSVTDALLAALYRA